MKNIFRSSRDKLLYHEPESYKYTWFLIIFLSIVYGFEYLYLRESLETYMTFTTDIFSLSFIYTLFTSIFLHLNLIHLLSNLLGLYIFGRLVERHLGVGLIFAFIIGGVFSNIVSHAISFFLGDLYFSLGASGGIAALIILGILFEPLRFSTFFGWFLIYIDVVSLGKETTTNHLAHIGGYLALILLFFFMDFRNRQKLVKGVIINFILLLIIGYLVTFTSLF